MTDTKTVLVTGATGLQGGAVARALISAGHAVRALTRNPDGAAAKLLALSGATVVGGSFDAPETVRQAAEGADAMFLMGNYYESGAEGETRHGIAGAEAARAAGVTHLIYSSVADANKATGIPHFESKFKVEQYIAGLGIGSTIVAPVAFMENLVAPWSIDGLRNGAIAAGLPADRQIQLIAAADIGAFVAAVVSRGERLFGSRYDIAGDALSGSEQAAIMTRATGRSIDYRAIPLDIMRQQSADTATMFDWLDRVGYDADLGALRRDFPDVRWTRFADWAGRQDWPTLAGEIPPMAAVI